MFYADKIKMLIKCQFYAGLFWFVLCCRPYKFYDRVGPLGWQSRFHVAFTFISNGLLIFGAPLGQIKKVTIIIVKHFALLSILMSAKNLLSGGMCRQNHAKNDVGIAKQIEVLVGLILECKPNPRVRCSPDACRQILRPS